MATSHQPFPSRPYTSGLTRGGGGGAQTPYASQTPFGAPQQNPISGFNTTGAGGGGGGGGGGFGTAGPSGTTQQQQQREAQRLERERHERMERERREAEERDALERISEEQREEINEAVSRIYSIHSSRPYIAFCFFFSHEPLLIRRFKKKVSTLRPRQRLSHRLPRTQSRS